MREDIYDPAFVAALFDRCSARYRLWSMVSSFGFIWLWRRQCVSRLMGQRQVARIAGGALGPKPHVAADVVDLMAGTGEVWPHLLAALPRARITAIDISPRMHDAAVSRLHKERGHHIQHLAADALTHELPEASADCVIATFGLKTCNPAQQAQLAKQIARVLRPGGTYALIEASDPKGWVLRPIYRLYLDRLLPLIELLFLRGAQDFAMIGVYTRDFGDCSLLSDALRKEGLQCSMTRHFFGCATSVAGIKPVAPTATAP